VSETLLRAFFTGSFFHIVAPFAAVTFSSFEAKLPLRALHKNDNCRVRSECIDDRVEKPGEYERQEIGVGLPTF
jgi:hypothetical protein